MAANSPKVWRPAVTMSPIGPKVWRPAQSIGPADQTVSDTRQELARKECITNSRQELARKGPELTPRHHTTGPRVFV